MSSLRTRAEARDWLARHGVTITQWARRHGFKPTVVGSLLAGRTQGNWGQAHGAAVALGLKPAPVIDEAHPLGDAADLIREAKQGAVR